MTESSINLLFSIDNRFVEQFKVTLYSLYQNISNLLVVLENGILIGSLKIRFSYIFVVKINLGEKTTRDAMQLCINIISIELKY